MTIARALAVAVATTVLAACATTPQAPATTGPTPTVAASDLQALRIHYGLPDCPDTDPAADQVDGGLPVTALPCLGSHKHVNLAGLPRTPTIINLWAQWCEPCRAESPYLRSALAELTDVSFIGINYDDPQPDWAIEFASLVGWNYPHVTDEDRQLRVPLGVPGLPTTYFVDADGRIAGVHAGQFTSAQQVVDLAERYLGAS